MSLLILLALASALNTATAEQVLVPQSVLQLSESSYCRAYFWENNKKHCLNEAQLKFALSNASNSQLLLKESQDHEHSRALLDQQGKTSTFSSTYKSIEAYHEAGFRPWQRFSNLINKLRLDISEQLAQSGKDPAFLARKILLNEAPQKTDHSLLRALGFVHILSASGIHLYALSAAILRIIQQLTIFGPKRRKKLAIAVSALGWFWAFCLCGARVGMIRPMIIVLLRQGALSLGFRWRHYSPLVLSLSLDFVYSLLTSHAAYNNGRWHYALAVGGGLAALELIPGHCDSKYKTLRQHIYLSVGSWAPVALWDLCGSSLCSPLTPVLSLLTIPLISQLIYPILLLGSLSLETHCWLLTYSSWLLNETIHILSTMALHCSALWTLDKRLMLVSLACAAVSMCLFFVLPRKKALILSTGLLLVSLLATSWIQRWLPQRPLALQLDVGQGDAALFRVPDERTKQQSFMIDTGPLAAANDVAWVELFARQQIQSLDSIWLTHNDEDHSGALSKISRLIKIDNRRPTQLLGMSIDSHRERNSKMSIYALSLGAKRLYLNTGDLAGRDERFALGRIRHLLNEKQVALKVAHHGSRDSNTEQWLCAVHPQLALVSAGLGNRYQHPHTQTLQRLKKQHALIQRTDIQGGLDIFAAFSNTYVTAQGTTK